MNIRFKEFKLIHKPSKAKMNLDNGDAVFVLSNSTKPHYSFIRYKHNSNTILIPDCKNASRLYNDTKCADNHYGIMYPVTNNNSNCINFSSYLRYTTENEAVVSRALKAGLIEDVSVKSYEIWLSEYLPKNPTMACAIMTSNPTSQNVIPFPISPREGISTFIKVEPLIITEHLHNYEYSTTVANSLIKSNRILEVEKGLDRVFRKIDENKVDDTFKIQLNKTESLGRYYNCYLKNSKENICLCRTNNSNEVVDIDSV